MKLIKGGSQMTKKIYVDAPVIKQRLTPLPLSDHIKEIVTAYYKNSLARGIKPKNVYELLISEVELPLIQTTMEYTGGNQSRAANILGINRGTFRKKLAHYGIS